MATPDDIQKKIAIKRQLLAMAPSENKWEIQKTIAKLELEKKLSALKKN
jgi:hypothetical protein